MTFIVRSYFRKWVDILLNFLPIATTSAITKEIFDRITFLLKLHKAVPIFLATQLSFKSGTGIDQKTCSHRKMVSHRRPRNGLVSASSREWCKIRSLPVPAVVLVDNHWSVSTRNLRQYIEAGTKWPTLSQMTFQCIFFNANVRNSIKISQTVIRIRMVRLTIYQYRLKQWFVVK